MRTVEYNRVDTKMKERVRVVTATATISRESVTGWVKLGTTPGGGFAEGILLKSIPGAKSEAILTRG